MTYGEEREILSEVPPNGLTDRKVTASAGSGPSLGPQEVTAESEHP